ncbi:MAG TPA: hypothetical protein VFV79_06500 [Saprospiraceae bacterium]|nr:hypothetical protein [Saprospiraceae bacterium]
MFCILSLPLFSQIDVRQLNEWAASFSSKVPDPKYNLDSLLIAFQHADSSNQCAALNYLIDKSPPKDPVYKIRLTTIKAYLSVFNINCGERLDGEQLVKEILQQIIQLNDEHLIYRGYLDVCSYYSFRKNHAVSSFYGRMAFEFWQTHLKQELKFQPVMYYMLAYNYYYNGEYPDAVIAGHEALKAPDAKTQYESEILPEIYVVFSWNLIGLAYEKMEKFDSAFYAFDKALDKAVDMKNEFWIGLIQGNRGDIFYKLGKVDSAEVLLRKDFETSLKFKVFDNASNSLQWLARITAQKGDPQKALRLLDESMNLYRKIPNQIYLENILQTYAEVYIRMRNPDSVLLYSKRFQHLHDSLRQAEYSGRNEVVNMRLDHQESINKIQNLQKEKNKIVLIRNFIILIILLAFAFVLLYFNRQRLKMRLHQQKVLEEKRRAEAEVTLAQEKLESLTERLLERNNLVENLQDQMMKKGLTDTQIQDIQALSQHTILTDEDWNHFKEHFEKVYPGFFIRLKEQSPDISLAELRMASLCKLKLSSKEAGTLLGISRDSVNKSKQRLRQRLGLEPDADLEIYFAKNW